MSDDLFVRPNVTIPRAELSWRFSRSSGPGGQSVNTTDSKVELRWNPGTSESLPGPLKARALHRLADRLVEGEIVVTASEHRSQLMNRKAAEARMVALLEEAIAPPPKKRRPTRPSRGAVQARLDAKRRRGDIKRARRSRDDN